MAFCREIAVDAVPEANFDVNIVPPSERFAPVSAQAKEKLHDSFHAPNTKKATSRAMKTFRDWLHSTGQEEDVDFETVTAEQLDTLLDDFYFSARTKAGENYKSSSLVNTRHGINRYLEDIGRDFNIISGESFKSSNKTFKSKCKELKRLGKGDTDHHLAITDADRQKCTEYFSRECKKNPVALQLKVFFDLMLHLVRRGRENLRELTKSHFAVATDSVGKRYVYQCIDELTKNHQEDTSKSGEGRMYETGGDLCPVTTFQTYLAKLSDKSQVLFQQPRSNAAVTDKFWYLAKCLGHNQIGDLMPRLSSEAKLSARYTNHCLRATAITVLDQSNFASRHIMTVSGHKAETSLKTYAGKTSENTLRQMSSTISTSLVSGSDFTTDNGHPVESELPAISSDVSTVTHNTDFIMDNGVPGEATTTTRSTTLSNTVSDVSAITQNPDFLMENGMPGEAALFAATTTRSTTPSNTVSHAPLNTISRTVTTDSIPVTVPSKTMSATVPSDLMSATVPSDLMSATVPSNMMESVPSDNLLATLPSTDMDISGLIDSMRYDTIEPDRFFNMYANNRRSMNLTSLPVGPQVQHCQNVTINYHIHNH